MKNVIAFGGSGFIGRNVVNELVKKGYNVTIFDINPPENNFKNINFISGDFCDFKKVKEAIANQDVVYNHAGIVDIDIANTKPYETLMTNLTGNLNILEACVQNKINRYVFASTIYVYSEKGLFYRCSKQISEIMIETYQKKFGLDYTILRYGSIYGHDANKNNWVNDILIQAIQNKKIVRKGDGEELREYIHVEDAAKASVHILSSEFINENVILTGNSAIKVKDLLLLIKEMFGNQIEIEYLPGDYDEHYEITPYTFKPKLGKKLSVNPHIDLGQGLLDLLYKINESNGNTH